jgi:hypothetical protein
MVDALAEAPLARGLQRVYDRALALYFADTAARSAAS